MLDPTLQIALLVALENAINQALELDPGTRNKLTSMTGCSFHICCTQPELDAYIVLSEDGIALRSRYETDNPRFQPTASLKGPLTAYFQLLGSSDKGAELINGELQFSGNSQPLLELQKIFAHLDLDWEAQLAPLIGDIPTHFIGKSARHLWEFGQQSKEAFTRHLEEFLHEEGRLLPGKDEIEDFYDDLSQLKLRSERLEARIQRLAQRLKP
jgi:ubiquinone biosynthesis protein UbiJ